MKSRVAAGCAGLAFVAAAAAAPGCPSSTAQVLEQVNALRAQGASCGSKGRFAPAAALAWDDTLAAMARRQASWLAFTDRLQHVGPRGEALGERAREAGYRFSRIAENLAQGQHSLADALKDWTRSEGHCANLYGAAFTQTALACETAADGRPLWVMLYATPG